MSLSALTVSLLAQAEASGPPTAVIIGVAIVVVLGLIIYFATRGPKVTEAPKAEPPEVDEMTKPQKNLLEDRMEVDAPVEIHEGMSLAEIKRAKAARVKGKDKAKRETAVEATEKAKADHDDDESVEEPAAETQADADAPEPVEAEPEPDAEVSEAGEEDVEAVEAAEAAEASQAEEPEKNELPKPKLPDIGGLPAPSEASEVSEAADEGAPKKSKLPKPKLGKLPKPGAKKEEAVAEAAAEEDAAEAATEADAAEVAQAAEVAEPDEEPAAPETPIDETNVAADPEMMVDEPPPGDDTPDEPEVGRTLEQGLAKTRSGFIQRLSGLFQKETLDPDIVDEVEEVLFTADIGPGAAQKIMDALEEELGKDEKQDPGAVWRFVRGYVEGLLAKREEALDIEAHHPFVILVIGVNGVGKTTTIGKMASKYRRQGKTVMMVAGDTFRAAAVEQLEVWGERAGIEVYKGKDEQDPASVVYEGIEKAVADDIDVVICDTAGRLQTNTNLLDELGKIGRVAGKVVEGSPHETILVLDANTGQNAIQQAKLFNEAVDISGIVLTKLDGTAKGGVILGICDEIDAPIRYIGIGEGVADLRRFDSEEFVEALFM